MYRDTMIWQTIIGGGIRNTVVASRWNHAAIRARFLSLARSKLRPCSANHRRPGYWSNLPCDWPSTAWACPEQETENGPWSYRPFGGCQGYFHLKAVMPLVNRVTTTSDRCAFDCQSHYAIPWKNIVIFKHNKKQQNKRVRASWRVKF